MTLAWSVFPIVDQQFLIWVFGVESDEFSGVVAAGGGGAVAVTVLATPFLPLTKLLFSVRTVFRIFPFLIPIPFIPFFLALVLAPGSFEEILESREFIQLFLWVYVTLCLSILAYKYAIIVMPPLRRYWSPNA